MDQYIERVVDLTEASENDIYDLPTEEARKLLLHSGSAAVGTLKGSFALVARCGRKVRMARSLDRPMRYFLAKRKDGPVLVVAARIDTIFDWLRQEGLSSQFHPNYTRMVPAHHVVELELVGCPDPDPVYSRFFKPDMATLPADTAAIGRQYVATLAEEIALWVERVPQTEPIGVCFSGGVDSGSVFLVTYHIMQKRGMNLGRLKAFVLDYGGGPDSGQARLFLHGLGLGLFLEEIRVDRSELDVTETIRVIEDYKSLDVESATMVLALSRGIRRQYPEWRYLIDGDGGDENLKDYPIEANPELTIRSVINNSMLYQEGWGVGKIKHSLTYSGGLSRSYARTYAPLRHHGFFGFSPFTRPRLIALAEAIPFVLLTNYDEKRLYELKGEIVSCGVQSLTGYKMPVFEKCRFQHGAMPEASLRRALPFEEGAYRRQFLSLYE